MGDTRRGFYIFEPMRIFLFLFSRNFDLEPFLWPLWNKKGYCQWIRQWWRKRQQVVIILVIIKPIKHDLKGQRQQIRLVKIVCFLYHRYLTHTVNWSNWASNDYDDEEWIKFLNYNENILRLSEFLVWKLLHYFSLSLTTTLFYFLVYM